MSLIYSTSMYRALLRLQVLCLSASTVVNETDVQGPRLCGGYRPLADEEEQIFSSRAEREKLDAPIENSAVIRRKSGGRPLGNVTFKTSP